ncbi:MAG TPA: hypothetical protein VGZ23_15620, partial [bacterium]|nr:hypothetical protein [bacterium]
QLGCSPARPDDLVALAALGTVADVVALTGDNRRLVAAGLRQLRADPPLGIRVLLEEAAIAGPVDTWHIGWQIAPRLNAPGRLGDPAPSLDLLLTDDAGEARVLARSLDAANRERQAVLEQVLTEAMAQVEDAAAVRPAPDGAARPRTRRCRATPRRTSSDSADTPARPPASPRHESPRTIRTRTRRPPYRPS